MGWIPNNSLSVHLKNIELCKSYFREQVGWIQLHVKNQKYANLFSESEQIGWIPLSAYVINQKYADFISESELDEYYINHFQSASKPDIVQEQKSAMQTSFHNQGEWDKPQIVHL